MCTAATYQTKDFYFGRTLDYEFSYGDEIVVTPRKFPLDFCHMGKCDAHYGMIGMAHVADGYPLYYDAVNEKGVGMAGLNFVGNAVYQKVEEGRENVAQYELIPWVLGQCANLQEVRKLLAKMNLVGTPFGDFPAAQLHWIIADASGAITLECTKDGLQVYDNPAEVLTNNPPFDYQMTNLSNYLNLTPWEPENHFSSQLDLTTYCKGMGALGLPGDLSSVSRFVRAAFTRLNAVSGPSEAESVSQFFHILGSVAQQRGCVHMGEGKYEITIYTSCCNADRGIYYYTTYGNHRITAVDMHKEDMDGTELVSYPLVKEQQIRLFKKDREGNEMGLLWILAGIIRPLGDAIRKRIFI